MGRVKEHLMDMEIEHVKQYLNPDNSEVVLFKDTDGWFKWTTANWWNKPEHAQYKAEREFVMQSKDLIDILCARDAYNQMLHGETNKPIY